LERQVNLETHRDIRSRFALVTGLGWLLWNAACGVLHRTEVLRFTPPVMVANAALAIVLCGTMLFRARRDLLETRVNRQTLLLLFSGVASVPVLWLAGGALGIGVLETVALSGCLYVFFAAAVSGMVDRRAVWTLPPAVAFAAAAALAPRFAFEWVGVAGCSIAIGLALVWRRPAEIAEAGTTVRE
jgi:hypothetical protein